MPVLRLFRFLFAGAPPKHALSFSKIEPAPLHPEIRRQDGPFPSHGLLRPKYRPDIDGLRAIAVLSVVAYHAYPDHIRGGFIGVDIFFVISGYLISTIILQNIEKGAFSFAEFYSRRIRRIFPALTVVLFASWCLGLLVLLPDEFEQLGRHIAAGAVFGSNFQLWSEAGYFDQAARLKPLLHLWILGIEEQFYIVWPLVLWLARRRTIQLILIAGLAAGSFYLNVTSIKADTVATFYSPATRFWELGCGGLLAWWRLTGIVSLHRATMANIVSVAGFILLIHGFSRINVDVGFPGLWALIPVLGAVLTIAAGPDAWLNRHILSHPVAVWFGLISYPLYLWHWPVLTFFGMTFGNMTNLKLAVPITLAVTLAWLTYRFIEAPIRLGRHRAAAVAAALAVCLFAVGCLGYAAHLGKGPAWGWRTSLAEVEGDTGHEAFYRYVAGRYHTCPPQILADQLGRRDQLRCMQSKVGAPVDVAIIGDSHAEQLFPGLAEALPPLNVAEYIGRDAPITGGRGYDTFFSHVLATPSIKYVILATFWHMHVLEMPEGSSEDREILSVIDTLTRAGKMVYVSDDAPAFPFDAHTCKRYRWFGWKRCEVDSDTELKRNGSELAALSKAIEGRTDVRMLAIRRYFCDNAICSMIKNGRILYRDDHHINIEGSLMVGRKLVEDNEGIFNR